MNRQIINPGQSVVVAFAVEYLYLLTLLIVPGLAFIVLLFLCRFKRKMVSSIYLTQTVSASIWRGLLIIVIFALILLLGGIDGPYSWMTAFLYFTIVYARFIIMGMLGLVKMLAGSSWRYPLVSRPMPVNC